MFLKNALSILQGVIFKIIDHHDNTTSSLLEILMSIDQN